MNHNNNNRRSSRWILALAFAGALSLVGCANKPVPLYDWQGYQNNVNEYLRGDRTSLDTQTKAMEDDLKKMRAESGVVPPGYNAHLGLLYAKQGNLDEFANRLDAEKAQFPESQSFVDFLLRSFKDKK